MNTASSSAAPRGITTWFSRSEAWLDERGKKAWIAAMVVSFIIFWPVGLALLAYMIWSKRMFSRSHCSHRRDRHSHQMSYPKAYSSSGNTAFDSYKAEMLRRLENEQTAFETFLQRLREAKDKSEFDTFMEDRSRGDKQGDLTPEPKADY
jgi:Protein of unknown function (DUF2852)